MNTLPFPVCHACGNPVLRVSSGRLFKYCSNACRRSQSLQPQPQNAIMPTSVSNPIDTDSLKSMICEVQTPFPMTLQECFQLFALLDSAVTAIHSGFPDLLGIHPAACPVLEVLHDKFISSFHGGVLDGCRAASSTAQ